MSGQAKLMTAGGGGVILNPASSIASDVTVNVPSQNCTLGIQGPAFSAYAAVGSSLTGSAFTKVLFDTEEYDTNDNFTSSRFTPTVAGYYQINGALQTSGTTIAQAIIFKNGTQYKGGVYTGSNEASGIYIASSLVYCNGSTDYIEIYGYNGGSTLNTNPSISNTYFNGALVRAA